MKNKMKNIFEKHNNFNKNNKWKNKFKENRSKPKKWKQKMIIMMKKKIKVRLLE